MAVDPQIPAGNVYKKYSTRNPIARRLVEGFLRTFRELVRLESPPRSILEVGCGEGHLLDEASRIHPAARLTGLDLFSPMARLAAESVPQAGVLVADAARLPLRSEAFELGVCCEVLEHLPRPERALRELHRVLAPGAPLVASVPREPLWRLLNLARGAYLLRLGNTPGHLQHFGRDAFSSMLRREGFAVREVRTPLPWTFVLARRS